jgi:hypothetical protein
MATSSVDDRRSAAVSIVVFRLWERSGWYQPDRSVPMCFIYDPVKFIRYVTGGDGAIGHPSLVRWASAGYPGAVGVSDENKFVWIVSPGPMPVFRVI